MQVAVHGLASRRSALIGSPHSSCFVWKVVSSASRQRSCKASIAQGQCFPKWSPLGPVGVPGDVYALEVNDFGGGKDLYAAGDFTLIGGVLASGVAGFDGNACLGCSRQRAERTRLVLEVDPERTSGGTLRRRRVHDRRRRAGQVHRQVERQQLVCARQRFERQGARDRGDPAGCGFFIPGVGEALVAPFPSPLIVSLIPFVAPSDHFSISIPNKLSFVGQSVGLQTAVASLVAPFMLELSSGWLLEIRPGRAS